MEVPQSGTFKAVELPKPTTTVARCFGVVDIGTVDNTFPGKTPKTARKIAMMFELPQFKAVFSEEKGLQPFMVMVEHPLSSHPDSNFYKFTKSWRNMEMTEEEKLNFPIEKMINKIALISFQYKTKVKYRNVTLTNITNENTNLVISGIGPVPQQLKDLGVEKMNNEPILWLWEDITKRGMPFDQEKFKKIYKFLRTKIYTSQEFLTCSTAVNVDAQQAQQPQQASSQPEQVHQTQPGQVYQAPVQQNVNQPPQQDTVDADDWS